MDLTEIVARRVRELRLEAELSQEELAHRAGVSARYLVKIEGGQVSPSVKVLGQLADGLAVDPAELVRGRIG